MKRTTTVFATGALLFAPALALAQGFTGFLLNVDLWIRMLTRIVGALALLAFFWGLVKYIFAAGDEGAKAEGKKIMVGGVIALFVLFSVFGIIRFLRTSFGVTNNGPLGTPHVLP